MRVQNNNAKKCIHVYLRECDMFTQCCSNSVSMCVCVCERHREMEIENHAHLIIYKAYIVILLSVLSVGY